MINKNSFTKLIPLVLGVLVISFVLSFWAVAWTEPAENPPDGNVSSPLNVGSLGQTKTGWLATLDSLWVGLQHLSGDWSGMLVVAGGALINSNAAPVGLIVAEGNVGIGTTTMPSQRLDVNGQVRATDVCTTAGTCLSTAGGGSSKWTDSGNNIYNNNSGNVGIGKTNPSEKLDVSGNIKASGDICTGSKCLNSVGGGTNYWTGSGNNIYNNNSGNVGIGTSNPWAKLTVVGDLSVNGSINLASGGGNISGLSFPVGPTEATSKAYVDSLAMQCVTRSSQSIVSNGGVGNYWSVSCLSDETAVSGGVSCDASGSCVVPVYLYNVFISSAPGPSSRTWNCNAYYSSIIPGSKTLTCVARCCKI